MIYFWLRAKKGVKKQTRFAAPCRGTKWSARPSLLNMADFSIPDPGPSQIFPRMRRVSSTSHPTPHVRKRLSSRNSNTSRQSYAEWVQYIPKFHFKHSQRITFYQISEARKFRSPRSMLQFHEDISSSSKPNHQNGCTHQASPQDLPVQYLPLDYLPNIHISASLHCERNERAWNVSLPSNTAGFGPGCVGCTGEGCGDGSYPYLW